MTKTSRSDWLIPAALIALSLIPAAAGTARVAELARGAEVTASNARFFAAPVPVLLHIPAVIVYSMLGALQFSPGFRRRHRKWHRSAGKLLVVCGLVTALSGLWMAQFYTMPPSDNFAVYVERIIAGTAMIASIILALGAVRRRDFESHGAWMIRAYAIGLGAGTQVLTHIPWFVLVGGMPSGAPRAVMMGAGWGINVVVAEWIVRRGRMRRPASLGAIEHVGVTIHA